MLTTIPPIKVKGCWEMVILHLLPSRVITDGGQVFSVVIRAHLTERRQLWPESIDPGCPKNHRLAGRHSEGS